MKNQSIKESILDYLSGSSKIFEKNGPTGPSPKTKVAVEADDTKKRVDDPDVDAKNPDVADLMSEGFASHNSILFLTSPDEKGIIKRGGNMGWIELNEEIVKGSGKEIDLEDFQWICPTDEFNAYLSKTGRAYSKDSDEWTSEAEKNYEKERKISTYSNFLNEKEKYNGEINEFLGFPTMTSKGMVYQKEDPNFQGGKLTDSQRKFIKFYFAKNKLRNEKILKDELDLKSLKVGDIIEIFVCALDVETGGTDTESSVGVTFEVQAVIPAQGDIPRPLVAGKITQIAPNTPGKKGSGFSSVLDAVVKQVYTIGGELEDVLSTTTGKLFTSLAALSAVYKIGILSAIPAWKFISMVRFEARLGKLVSSGMYKNADEALAAAKRLKWYNRGGRFLKNSGIVKFIKYPFTVGKRAYRLSRRAMPVLKGWKAAKYIFFGAKVISTGSKLARAGAGLAKLSNPVGWVLLVADVVGSGLNYTSDNQAPSWAPIIGDKTDKMINYASKDKGGDGTCPNATNVFIPSKIKTGENMTLCWTQSPGDSIGIALSFVVSNTTRTTMNITKILDFKPEEKMASTSLFLINMINSKGLWDEVKTFDLRFLFIKDGKYEEGFRDDNIGAYFLGAKANPDKNAMLPLAYDGHCTFATFGKYYAEAKDQLIYIDEDAPDTYNFHFEDRESNIINVYGKKVTDKDIENASSSEISDFFDVQPVSSMIGNPDEETEEEKKERENLEKISKNDDESNPDDQEGESESTTGEISTNENVKWYSQIEGSKPITSFGDFKLIKESLLLEKDPPVLAVEETPEGEADKKEGEGGDEKSEASVVSSSISSAKDLQENFQNIINTIEKPIPFSIYFVELREYADPDLRSIYKAGTFTNFSVNGDSITASDDSSIEGSVQVNNLDVLIDPRKGIYNYSDKDRDTNIKAGDREKDGDVESTDNIRTSILAPGFERSKFSGNLSSDVNTEEIKSTLGRMDPDDLSKLGISNWTDVTSVKIIRDENGKPVTVKIKNKKAKLLDKSRRFDSGDSTFNIALDLAQANKDKEQEEELLSSKK
jgi:hypothetical protein